MIRIGEFKADNYCCTIMGNDGEEQLIVAYSPSQAMRGPVVILAMQIDGGAKLLVNRTGDGDNWVPDNGFSDLLTSTIRQWAYGGISPSKKQAIEIEAQIAKAVGFVMRHYHADPGMN